MRAWHAEHTALLRCCSICSRSDTALPFFFACSSGTSGGGGGGGVPRRFSRIHFPRWTTDVRFGYDVSVSTLPWPEKAAPIGIGDRHAAEVRSVDLLDAVVIGEPLVQVGVIGSQKVEQASIFPDDAGEQELGFFDERLTQRFVERKNHRVGLHGFDVAQVQPLPGEVRDERIGARIGQHAPDLALEDHWVFQPAAFGQIEQLVVGDRAPQKERQPRRELEIADSIGCLAGLVALDAEQKLRRDEQRLKRVLNSSLKIR